MGNMIKVGMADLNVCRYPDNLTTLGLGSCIGACIYDPVTKIIGMVHYMLPDSTQIRNNQNIAKFGDTGIAETVSRMEKMGASRSRMVAKIAGGAQMFATSAGAGENKNAYPVCQQDRWCRVYEEKSVNKNFYDNSWLVSI